MVVRNFLLAASQISSAELLACLQRLAEISSTSASSALHTIHLSITRRSKYALIVGRALILIIPLWIWSSGIRSCCLSAFSSLAQKRNSDSSTRCLAAASSSNSSHKTYGRTHHGTRTNTRTVCYPCCLYLTFSLPENAALTSLPAHCTNYLCPGTLSCVHFPHHCPCAWESVEDKVELGNGIAICANKGGYNADETMKKIELARKGLL